MSWRPSPPEWGPPTPRPARAPRAATFHHQVRDPVRAQQNRLDRDVLIAQDAVDSARRLGIRVIEVDGSRDAEAVADIVAEQFSSYLRTD